MKKSILKSAAMLAAISLSFLTFSCDKPLSSSLFDQKTVETSRNNATVTITLKAGGFGSQEAVWELGNEKLTTRTLTGVIGTPLGIDNPTLYGYACAGWTNDDIPGDTPKKLETFPEESGSYTAQWGEVVKVVRLQRKRIGLEAGKGTTFTVQHLPESISNPTLYWSSSNPDAVTVDETGTVKVKDGAAVGAKSVIKVMAASGEFAECEIIVIETNSYFERVGAYTTLPSYTSPTGVANTGSNYVSFGTFPQSLKSSSVQIYGEEWDSRKGAYVTTRQGGMTYYLGTDNCWYAKVDAEPNGFENFTDNKTPIINSERYYFKVEPLKWRIVSTEYKDGNNNNNNTLLFSEYGIVTGIPYYGAPTRTLNGETIYPNNYKYSNIRAYLNGTKNQFESDGGTISGSDVDWTGKGFIDIAFTASQKAKIKTTTVDNSAKSTGFGNDVSKSVTNRILEATSYTKGSFVADDIPAYACDNTEDKIFLLSQTEVSNEKDSPNYLGFGVFWRGFKMLQRITTDYARALGGAQESASCSRWWLRSPKVMQTPEKKLKADSSAIGTVRGEGKAMEADTYNVATNTIVPALCVE